MPQQLKRGDVAVVDHLVPNADLPSQYRQGARVGVIGVVQTRVHRTWTCAIPGTHYLRLEDGRHIAVLDEELQLQKGERLSA